MSVDLNSIPMEVRQAMQVLGAYSDKPLTPEQTMFASNFTQSRVSFSYPGTGKTQTITTGVILAQSYYKVPGEKICIMSYTNNAVGEMKQRYESICKAYRRVPASADIRTFHSLSLAIVKQAWPDIKIVNQNYQESVDEVMDIMKELNLGDDPFLARRVYNAITNLNASLTFDEQHVRETYSFIKCGLSYEEFTEVRKRLFGRNVVYHKLTQGEIPLYALYLLKVEDRVKKYWKGKYQIVIVDEFQDMSIMYLYILHEITDNLIAIGDMHQQIYLYNGACPVIMDKYRKLYPNAIEQPLTQSFRCKKEIADFASHVYSEEGDEKVFTGTSTGGNVTIKKYDDLEFQAMLDEFVNEVKVKSLARVSDTMFLYRINAASIPIIEALYRANIPFRCPKYTPVYSLPLYREAIALIEAAIDDKNMDKVIPVLKMFPEFSKDFKDSAPSSIAIVIALQQSGKGLLDVPYRFNESSERILEAMRRSRELYNKKVKATYVIQPCYTVYLNEILKGKTYYLEKEPEYYEHMCNPILQAKTYDVMMADEIRKQGLNENYIKTGVGVRCYTLHASKGLEADDIHILDCDMEIFPNAKKFGDLIDAQCYTDAAFTLQAECNLLYVGITRARTNCTIYYNSELTSIIADPAGVAGKIRKFLEVATVDYPDVEAFYKLMYVEDTPTAPTTPTNVETPTPVSTVVSNADDLVELEEL